MLSYDFMQIAFVAALLLGIALPLIGSGAIYKGIANSGDALAHSALAGVAIGLAAGLNTTAISIITTVVGLLIVELLRNYFSKYVEIGLVVVLSAAIGLVGILSNKAGVANLNSYLFGSIILIDKTQLIITAILTVLIVVFVIVFGPQLFCVWYSKDEAKVHGIKAGILNAVHSILLGLTVAIGEKIVGSLVIASMIILPCAMSLTFKKGYWFTLVSGVIISVASMLIGLTISYYADWAPGATIVLLTITILVLVLLTKGFIKLVGFIKNKERANRQQKTKNK